MEFKIPRWFVLLVCWIRNCDKIELGLIVAIILCILGILISSIYQLYYI